MNILAIMISCCTAAVGAVAAYLVQRSVEKRERQYEAKERLKSHESVLILKSINAVGKLALAIALGTKDERVTAAMEEYQKTDNEIYAYLLESNALQLTKDG